jgi:hypothetical protein
MGSRHIVLDRSSIWASTGLKREPARRVASCRPTLWRFLDGYRLGKISFVHPGDEPDSSGL